MLRNETSYLNRYLEKIKNESVDDVRSDAQKKSARFKGVSPIKVMQSKMKKLTILPIFFCSAIQAQTAIQLPEEQAFALEEYVEKIDQIYAGIKLSYHCDSYEEYRTHKKKVNQLNYLYAHTIPDTIGEETQTLFGERAQSGVDSVALPSDECGEEQKEIIFTYKTIVDKTYEILSRNKVNK